MGDLFALNRRLVEYIGGLIIVYKYNNKSLLLAKEASVNTSKLREFISSGIKVSPLIKLLICH